MARYVVGHAHELRAAGHDVEVVRVDDPARAGAAGHTRLPDGMRPLEQARRMRRAFDIVVATSWRATYALGDLGDAVPARLVTGDERPGLTEGERALVERTWREPELTVLALGQGPGRWLTRELGREARAVPLAVAPGPPSGARRREGPLRVVVIGSACDIARALEIVRAVGGLELWVASESPKLAPDGLAARWIRDLPPSALPALLGCCDVLLAPSGESAETPLLQLEMMARGGAVVAAAESEVCRAESTALVAPDAIAAMRALERLRDDPGLREHLGRAGRATALEHDLSKSAGELGRLLQDIVREGVRPPPWRRAELAAIHGLIGPRTDPAGSDSVKRIVEGAARHGVRVVRRALRRRAAAAAAPLSLPRPMSTVGPRRASEPVLFVGQPAYFRSVYHDAVVAGWGGAAPVDVSDLTALEALPDRVAAIGARTCVVFQPEYLSAFPSTIAKLRRQGVRLVAYSTEPIPGATQDIHWDQLRRLDALRPTREVSWDLFIHFDPASLDTLRREGFGPLVAHPLPVSTALYHPEEAVRDFDVCFLGWSTPHREEWLAPLKARYRTLHVAHGAFDEEARHLMNRSHLVVNLHAHAFRSFENRCVQALFCERPLISEPLSNALLKPGEDFLLARSPRELLDHARALLEDGVAPPRPTFDRARFTVAALRDLLSGGAP